MLQIHGYHHLTDAWLVEVDHGRIVASDSGGYSIVVLESEDDYREFLAALHDMAAHLGWREKGEPE